MYKVELTEEQLHFLILLTLKEQKGASRKVAAAERGVGMPNVNKRDAWEFYTERLEITTDVAETLQRATLDGAI